MNDNIIFHIDVNSAYLSWTALKLLNEGSKIDIREVPSIVGGDQVTRHGIVVAKSIPAKAYGIETAETVASAFKKCPNLISVPPDHTWYSECSKKLMAHLSDICPAIEQVSIDECYMDYQPIKDQFESPEIAAKVIKDSVYETFGFTVNIGISDRKVLAKMASDFKKPNLVHTLYARECPEKLWPLPISRLHMCGKSSASLLRKMGIKTIGDLAKTEKNLVMHWLKKHGEMLWSYANGIDDSMVVVSKGPVKGVGNSTTLSKDLTTTGEVYPILANLAQSVSLRLKKKQMVAAQISTEIKYATFKSVSHQTTIQTPTNDYKQIYRQACLLFDELWDGTPVRLLGIRTTKLDQEDEPFQMNLFDFQEQLEKEEKQKEKVEKNKRLEQAIASIQNKYGKNAIRKGQ